MNFVQNSVQDFGWYQVNKCIVCSKKEIDVWYKVYDDRYGYPGLFKLNRCKNCGHIFLRHNFTITQLGDLYSNYYPRSNFDIDKYQPHKKILGFSSWLDGSKSAAFRWVPENVRILDIGCGFCRSLGYHANMGCDVYGVEVDENVRKIADKFGFNVHFGSFDSSLYDDDFFDYVTMDQVLEHMTDPIETIGGVKRVLRSGGVAIISFPNAHGWGAKVFRKKWIHWHAPYHLQFYSKKSIQILANTVGLSIVDMKTITPSEWLNYQWNHLIMYPNRSEPSKFWSGLACGKQVKLTRKEMLGIRCVSKLHKSKINHLITRFFDYIGLGDNRIVFLRKP